MNQTRALYVHEASQHTNESTQRIERELDDAMTVSDDPTARENRDDISHKHHKQRLCKIITTRVKFYFVDVF